jgi:adenosylcobinamide-phosphate synthase
VPLARGAGLAGAVALDALLGDPARWHPVAGFGTVAAAVERALYRPSRAAGVVHVLVLVVGPTAVARRAGGGALVLAVCGWAALGGRSLRRTAARMADLVDAGEVDAARVLARSLVARRTDALDGPELTRAALESLAENTADAEAGTLFWGAVAGAPGAVAHRAANTLDAMVGYKDERYAEFGWAAARLDDAVNWAPARLAALLTALCSPLVGGSPAAAWAAVRRDGRKHPSPNAGRLEAAFAGALGVRLGGPLAYAGVEERRPALGDGRPPAADDVRRAVTLSWAVGAAALAACALAARARPLTGAWLASRSLVAGAGR